MNAIEAVKEILEIIRDSTIDFIFSNNYIKRIVIILIIAIVGISIIPILKRQIKKKKKKKIQF